MNCDLHMHSIFSDGTYTPAEIVAEAKKIGLGEDCYELVNIG